MTPTPASKIAGHLSQADIELISIALSKCCENPEGPKINFKQLQIECPKYSTPNVASKAWLRVWRKLVAGGATSADGGPVGKPPSASATGKRGRKGLNDEADDEGSPAPKRGKTVGKKNKACITAKTSGDEDGEGTAHKGKEEAVDKQEGLGSHVKEVAV